MGRRLYRSGRRLILSAPILYTIATAAAFFNTLLSAILFVLVSLSYVVPRNIDAYWDHFRGEHRSAILKTASQDAGVAAERQTPANTPE